MKRGLFELPARLLGAAEGSMSAGRLIHLGIGIGQPAEAMEVQSPNMETAPAQLVAP